MLSERNAMLNAAKLDGEDKASDDFDFDDFEENTKLNSPTKWVKSLIFIPILQKKI